MRPEATTFDHGTNKIRNSNIVAAKHAGQMMRSSRQLPKARAVAEIEEMKLALKVALDALDVLEARVPKILDFPARPGPVINRFASRVAEGLNRARAAS